MELKIKSYLVGSQDPQTLEEVARSVSSTLPESESVLTQLLSGGNIICRDIQSKDDVRVYWRPSEKIHKCQHASSAEHIGGIRPPSRRSRLPFKSPARVEVASTTPTTPLSSRSRPGLSRRNRDAIEDDTTRLTNDIQKLKMKLEEVKREMEGLAADSYCEDELQVHIDKLHEYNEMKDTGQLLLGKIAEVEGTTTATLYEKFGLELDD